MRVHGGYRLLVVDDPDGNQLFLNYPNETASGNTVEDKANRPAPNMAGAASPESAEGISGPSISPKSLA
jgi:hypothetical protein